MGAILAISETTGYFVVGIFSALAGTVGVVIATRAKKQATEVSGAAAAIDSALEGYAGLIGELRAEVERLLGKVERQDTKIVRLEAYRAADRAEIAKCHDERDSLAERVRVLERSR